MMQTVGEVLAARRALHPHDVARWLRAICPFARMAFRAFTWTIAHGLLPARKHHVSTPAATMLARSKRQWLFVLASESALSPSVGITPFPRAVHRGDDRAKAIIETENKAGVASKVVLNGTHNRAGDGEVAGGAHASSLA
jgi:hypothetical protein